MSDEYRLLHSQLLYDYIKFHLGLYIATPPILAILATTLGVAEEPAFRWSMVVLVVIYFAAGAHASWLVASRINSQWTDNSAWLEFGDQAPLKVRRFIQHYLYWVGLIVALAGLALAARA